jgi:perosamine synthetase
MIPAKMLITGVSGLLGNNLALYFRGKFKVLGLCHQNTVVIPGVSVESIDLRKIDQVKRLISRFSPDIIIHCASLTNVDYCEENPEEATAANVDLTQNLVGCIEKDSHVKFIFISTDSVYGENEGLQHTEKITAPCNVYGKTKLQGEKVVVGIPNSLILRTNIFGWNIHNKNSLGEWILHELKQRSQIGGFKNAFFSTIYTFELARIIDTSIRNDIAGVYNCGSRDSCSKFDFAVKLADMFGFDKNLINSIVLNQHNFKAKRSKDLSLCVDKIEKELGFQLPVIDFSLEQFFRDYQKGLPVEIKSNHQQSKVVFNDIPYGRQWIDAEDISAIDAVLKSPNLTQGLKVTAFEEALKNVTGAGHAVAVNSGTSALHLACLAAGVTVGDEVITSPNTFVASANCAAFCGAKPVFADIDSRTYNISPQEIEKRITPNTKAIIPVHFAGQSADMEAIHQIVQAAESKYGHKIYIIEDASHALGSQYKNIEVGSCVYSDMAVMSFHPVKHITTGEGGAVLSNDENIDRRLRLFRSHGITKDPDLLKNNLGPWYYEQIDLGYNYRITDIQSALGISQLKKLSAFRKRRREIVDRYNCELRSIPLLQIPFESKDCNSNFHLYVILFDYEKAGMTRNSFKEALQAENILTQIHYIPVHTQPYYQTNFGTKWGDYPKAENYFEKCLSIPLYSAMSDDDVTKVIETVKKTCRGDR